MDFRTDLHLRVLIVEARFQKVLSSAALSGGITVVSTFIAIIAFRSAVRYWETDGILLMFLGFLGLIGAFIGYFYAPSSLLARDNEVGFRYLLGPTIWFPRQTMAGRLYLSTLKVTSNDTSWKARLFGSATFALGVDGETEAKQVEQLIGIPIKRWSKQ